MKIHDEKTNQWEWKALGAPAPVKKAMAIQTKALIQAPAMLGIAALMYFGFDHVVVPSIVAVLSVLVLVGGLFYHPLFHAVERGGRWFGHMVIVTVNWILLAPFYFLVFGFGRLVLRLQGIDPMDRAYPAAAETCWLPRKKIESLDQYRKQH